MYLPEFLNLGSGFRRYFRVVPALTDALRREVFAIRHAVYCEELGYEPIRADRLESDSFDAASAHCLLQGVKNGEYVGCVRIVLTDTTTELPIERLCRSTLDRSVFDPALADRTKIGEVSRLAVIAKYRRRKGEEKTPVVITEDDFGTPDRPRFPYIASGLYLAMLAQARHHRIETLIMLTERRLTRQLARLGVNLHVIGAPVEHRGIRYPSMMLAKDVIDGLHFFVRPLFDVIASEMEIAYQQSA
jgi:N-acyl amino acid synthase of PEP-CTERM/exosortase system